MSTREVEIAGLQAAIAAQDALRSALGDSVVDVTVGALRARLAVLQAERPAGPGQQTMAPEQLLARLHGYLPAQLAEKIRASGRVEGERKQVTVLFADLSGFTALSERLDPEDLVMLTNDALQEMAAAVYQYEGFIDKFVGDAVMAVFGDPVAHEDDPTRALRAALSMRERLRSFNRRWEHRLDQAIDVHIGVNTGPVVTGTVGTDQRLSYTVMGDTVNTASRIEGAAAPGQILVGAATYRLTSEAFAFEGLPPLPVKGKREPLAVHALRRARLSPGSQRGLPGLRPVLVERERELAQLHQVTEALERGEGRLVVVRGEAGIGKSRLMAEWRATFGDRLRWLEGRCYPHTSGLPYGPFVDLLHRHAGIQDDDTEGAAGARVRRMLAELLPDQPRAPALIARLLALPLSPDETAALQALPAEVLRRRLFELISLLLERLCVARPTVLALEDLHWVDFSSGDLLDHLQPLVERLPLAIVIVARPEPGPAQRLLRLGAARPAGRLLELQLVPLSPPASVAMVQGLLDTEDLPVALRALVHERGEGNPFFVEEVIRALIERGALVRGEGGGWSATPLLQSVTVPDTLQGLLMARLDRLPDETRRVVQQAAVIGRIFLYRVLFRVVEADASLDADMAHLQREELVRVRAYQPELEYAFKHALTQEMAYQSLLGPRRRELHRRVGEAIEQVFADRLPEFHPVLGMHFLRSQRWARATEYLLAAGDAALRLFAIPEARQHFAHALDALGNLPDSVEVNRQRVDTTIKRVNTALTAESPERSLELLRIAEALALALPGADAESGEDRLRLTHVRVALARIHHMRNDLSEALEYARGALEVAEKLQEHELLPNPLAIMGRVYAARGRYAEAAPLLARAAPLFERAGDWPGFVGSGGTLGICQAALGRPAEGLATGERGLERARALNFHKGVAGALGALCVIHFMGGDMERMLERSRRVIQLGQNHGEQILVHHGYLYQAWAQSRLGAHEAAYGSLAECQALARQLASALSGAHWLAAVSAEISLNAGRLEEAVERAGLAVDVSRAGDCLNTLGVAERVWGEALHRRDPTAGEEAERHLGTALEAFETGGMLLEIARTRVAWARLLAARGDRGGAREKHLAAIRQFDASGLERESADAELELRALG